MTRRWSRRNKGVTPRYFLRTQLALRTLRELPPGRFIEFGCGTGDLMVELGSLGFTGIGLEISPQLAELARKRTAQYGLDLQIATDVAVIQSDLFDYGLAFEVLEHIEDDLVTLREWKRLLKPGGLFLASVPAHDKYWTQADVAAGHIRRYEKYQIEALFTQSGFSVESVWSYGFPLTHITRRFRNAHASRGLELGERPSERTLNSALLSTVDIPAAAGLASSVLGHIGHLAQIPFLKTDLGDGWFVIARVSK